MCGSGAARAARAALAMILLRTLRVTTTAKGDIVHASVACVTCATVIHRAGQCILLACVHIHRCGDEVRFVVGRVSGDAWLQHVRAASCTPRQ